MRRSRSPDRFGVKRLSTLIGREDELMRLRNLIDESVKGNGGTIFIEGEAGIGKSRLIGEVKAHAEKHGARMLTGRGLEGASPYMPFVNAFSDVGPDLISPGEMSIIEEVFLLNQKGLLIAHAARTLRPGVDEATFGRVFATIKDFLNRSFESGTGEGSLDELQYGNFKILFENDPPFFLAVVVSGGISEDLRREMRNIVRNLNREFGKALSDWAPGEHVPKILGAQLSKFASMEFRTERRIEGLDPKREQDRMFDSVLNLLLAISRIRPVVLVIDDMQWLDDSSLDLLHYIARNIRDCRVLLIGAYRPEEGMDPETRSPLRMTETLRRMNRERLYSLIKLKRLSMNETDLMLNSIFKKNEFSFEFKEKMYNETEGNPFFVEEIVESLLAEGAIHEDEYGRWTVKEDMVVALPSTIMDVVMRRMDRLDEDFRKILETAAVMGPEFDIEVLRSVMDIDEEGLLVALDELDGMKLLREVPGGEAYAFDHVVIQEVIYENMSRNMRRMVHRRVAEILEDIFTTDPDSVVYELAKHYTRTRNYQKAFYYSLRAARRASRLFALSEASMYYGWALDNLSKIKDIENRMAMEVRLLNDSAIACVHIGNWDRASSCTEKVLEMAPSEELYAEMARAYRLRGAIGENRGNWTEAVLDLEAAIEISDKIEDLRGKFEAYHMLGRNYWRSAKYDRALEYLNECIRGAEAINDDMILATALITKGNVYNVRGDYEESIKLYERGLAIAKDNKNALEQMRAYNNLGDLFMDTGDLDQAETYFDRCREAAEKYGDQLMIGYSHINLGECALKRKDLDRAKAECSQALEIFTKLDERSMVAATYIDFGIMHRMVKNYAEASVCFDIAIDALETLGTPNLLAEAHREYGTMFIEKGDPINAASHLETALGIYKKAGVAVSVKAIERDLVKLRRGEDSYRVAIVGRDQVVDSLNMLLEEGVGLTGDSSGNFTLLEGEQGMGKSRVMGLALEHARSKGITTIIGRCIQSEMVSPFYPFIQALDDLFRGRDKESLKRFMRKVPLEVLAVLPGVEKLGNGEGAHAIQGMYTEVDGDPAPDLGAMKDRMFETLSRLLLDMDEPVALFLEDIHHADTSSLELLRRMAGEMEGSRTFIMASYSPDAVTESNSFSRIIKDMTKRSAFHKVTIGPMEKGHVKEIITRFLGITDVPDELTDKIHMRTKGNPMFVEELLKSLPKGLETEDLARMDIEKLHVPGSVKELIAKQLSTLSPQEREVLEYAAVAGFGFRPDLLFEAMGIGKEATKDGKGLLDGIVEKRYLVEKEEHSLYFGHPMVQQVVYQTVAPDKRKNMHRAFGRAIEKMSGNNLERVAFDLAYHFHRAGPSDKTFRYSILAGQRAEAMLAPRESEGFFRNAVRAAEAMKAKLRDDSTISAGEVLSARHHLYQALVGQGRLDEALEISRISLMVAKDVGDVARESQALMDIGAVGKIKASWEDAKSYFDQARRLCIEIGFQRGLFRALKELAWIAWRRGDFGTAFENSKRCIGIGEELNDKHLVAQGLTELGSAYGERGDWEEAIENLSKARAIFEASGDRYHLARVLNNIGVSYRDKGDPDGAVTHFVRCVDISRETGDARMMGYGLSNLSECHLKKGDLEKAEDTINRSLTLFIKLDEPYMVSSGYRRLGMIERMRDKYDDAEAYLMKSITLFDRGESPIHTAEVMFELGILEKARGNKDKAKEALDQSLVIFKQVGSKWGVQRVEKELELLEKE